MSGTSTHHRQGTSRFTGLWLAAALLTACGGSTGPAGTAGTPGTPGTPGAPGTPSTPGRDTVLTGPGLAITIQAAAVTGTTATVDFTITDGGGVPLDREGRFTAGAVELGFVLAHLAATAPFTYQAYTTRVQQSPGGPSATQAAAESAGSFAELGVGQGRYRYTFATPVNVVAASETHSVAVLGTRPFVGVTSGGEAIFNFLPGGGPVGATRGLVTDAACTSCHGALSPHGPAARGVATCVLCHQGQSSDPDTGNTLELGVMVHRIHRGRDLPSVIAGSPYRLVGAAQSVHDYSTVVHPQPIGRCTSCHDGPQGDTWKTRPSVAACGSCHDNVSFVVPLPPGQVLHGGGAMAPGAPCLDCHAEGSTISPIPARHLPPELDPAAPVPALTIVSVSSTGPGESPVVRFTVSVGGVPRDILSSPLTSLRATFAGPTTDYASSWQATIQGGGATGAILAIDAAAGDFQWTAPASAAIPVTATGSYAVGLEGYLQAVGGPTRYAFVNPVASFAVTDPAAVPRRTVVGLARCDGCHAGLSAHGGVRRDPQYCVLCHGPNAINDERAPRVEGQEVLVHSMNFVLLIHRLHMGAALTQPYLIGGFPGPSTTNPGGTPVDFGQVRYPRSRSDCTACHEGESYLLPLSGARLPSFDQVFACLEDSLLDTDSLCEPFSSASPATNLFVPVRTTTYQPEAAACLGCHDAPAAAAHAEVMTTTAGVESCGACHGSGKVFGVKVVHGLE